MSHQLDFHARIGPFRLRASASIRNEVICISGANGSGKTTLLRILAGLTPAEGTLLVAGKVWMDSVALFTLPPQERGVGCLWQHPTLLPWLSATDNITLGASPNDERLHTVAEATAVTPLLRRRPTTLSTGEVQRVGLARALYRRTQMLLLDEPFSAQTPEMRDHLRASLREIQQQRQIPLLLVSHDARDRVGLNGNHWLMREGKLWTGIEEEECEQPIRSRVCAN